MVDGGGEKYIILWEKWTRRNYSTDL